MSKQLSQVVASRLNMQPALISPSHADMMIDSLRQLATADSEREDRESGKSRDAMLATYGYSGSEMEKPFAFAAGLAFIPVSGLLINRFSYSWGWVTGYNYIRSMLHAALEDPDVTAIVFDCNSGGGEVSGCFELAADMRAARDKKPTMAVVDPGSYSACYALASSTGKIVVTPSGGVGSIGVVSMHVDYSKMLDDVGIKVTFIYSGDHKVDGNAYEPLPEPVRKSIQARVDATRQEFVSLVASNRGLDPKVVFDTQAKCFTASEAMDLGLIDAIAPPSEAVQAFLSELSGSKPDKEKTMSTSAAKPGAESTASPEIKQPDQATQTVDPVAERAAERERIKAITTHESAKDKAGLANHLALNTNLTVDAAAAILAAAAPEVKESAEKGSSAFAEAMEKTGNPNVGADGADNKEMTAAQKILHAQALATGAAH